MHMINSVASSLGLAAFLVLSATAIDYNGLYFVQDTGKALSIQRADPILSPGGQSAHVHSIFGANGFALTMDFAQTQTATCATTYIIDDKSDYWLPSLYFKGKDGKYTIVPEKPEHKLYYFNRAPQGVTVEGFPDEFRMLAGTNTLRSPPTTAQAQAITQWYCHGPPDVVASDGGFAKGFTSCDYGLAASIHFPHCWNGQPFDTENSHMSYPEGDHPDSGSCPDSHPHMMPHIFIEYWFNIDSFNGQYGANDNPWVLANGDPTGYGFHADFINGWTPGVLANAMATCDIGESGAPLSDCFKVYTDDERNACSQAPFFNENITGPLDALPGCNPIQAGPAAATKAVCNGEAAPTATVSTGNSTGNGTGTGYGSAAGTGTGGAAVSTSSSGSVSGSGATGVPPAGGSGGQQAGGSQQSGSGSYPPSSSSSSMPQGGSPQGGSGGPQGGSGDPQGGSPSVSAVAAAAGAYTVTVTASRETVTVTSDLCGAASSSSTGTPGRRIRRNAKF